MSASTNKNLADLEEKAKQAELKAKRKAEFVSFPLSLSLSLSTFSACFAFLSEILRHFFIFRFIIILFAFFLISPLFLGSEI